MYSEPVLQGSAIEVFGSLPTVIFSHILDVPEVHTDDCFSELFLNGLYFMFGFMYRVGHN